MPMLGSERGWKQGHALLDTSPRTHLPVIAKAPDAVGGALAA